MELEFVVSAIRRRFWVVTLLALVGAIPGLTADPVASSRYESVAVLSVEAPTRPSVSYLSVDPDRYVISQLAVLESNGMAIQVAQRVSSVVNAEISPSLLVEQVKIEQVPETNVVEIVSQADDPRTAAAISQAYADIYLESLETTADASSEQAALEAEASVLQQRLADLDLQLQTEMERFLPSGRSPNQPPVPAAEFVAPAVVSQRQLTLQSLGQVNSALAELTQGTRLVVNTELLAQANVPLEPLPTRADLLLVGGMGAGALVGIVLALMWARFSTKVLDDISAGEILGAPVVSEFSHYRSLARNPLAAFQSLPRPAVPIIDQLCVRAEALARIGEPLTVLVTGSMRSAGSTTLGLAMAERFAAGGASVAIVDADVRDPRVTALFNATSEGGIPAVIRSNGDLVDSKGVSVFTRTMDPAVSVLGLGSNRGAAALRRDTVPTVLDACHRKAEVVVVDGGPVLDLASTIQFMALADAVVLAVPLYRQKADALVDLGRQLESVHDKLLPVTTSPSGRTAKGQSVSAGGAIANQPGVVGLAGSPVQPEPVRSSRAPGSAESILTGGAASIETVHGITLSKPLATFPPSGSQPSSAPAVVPPAPATPTPSATQAVATADKDPLVPAVTPANPRRLAGVATSATEKPAVTPTAIPAVTPARGPLEPVSVPPYGQPIDLRDPPTQ